MVYVFSTTFAKSLCWDTYRSGCGLFFCIFEWIFPGHTGIGSKYTHHLATRAMGLARGNGLLGCDDRSDTDADCSRVVAGATGEYCCG
jgi:hypothetical protein